MYPCLIVRYRVVSCILIHNTYEELTVIVNELEVYLMYNFSRH